MTKADYIFLICAFLLAMFLSFASTPIAKNFAYKIGAIDVPKDQRRMHKQPIPRLGGLAIFTGFYISVLVFGHLYMTKEIRGMLIGSIIIIGLGMFDDVLALKPYQKFGFQLLAAAIPVYCGVRITSLPSIFGGASAYIQLNTVAQYIVTIIWLLGLLNAVNLIDGLDGLAVGVSSIATFSLFFIAILTGEMQVALITAALAGGCLGFLPYNFNPAKIFMGDTGSTFLGFMLSVVCIQGLFKGYVLISFIIPFLILGLPIFDTAFAIVRRIWNKKPIMAPDRGHLHHKLMDMGFSQKQTVAILYIITSILALSAVVVLEIGAYTACVFIITIVAFSAFAYKVYSANHKAKTQDENPKGDA